VTGMLHSRGPRCPSSSARRSVPRWRKALTLVTRWRWRQNVLSRVDAPTACRDVFVDLDQLIQVFLNVLMNALQALDAEESFCPRGAPAEAAPRALAPGTARRRSSAHGPEPPSSIWFEVRIQETSRHSRPSCEGLRSVLHDENQGTGSSRHLPYHHSRARRLHPIESVVGKERAC